MNSYESMYWFANIVSPTALVYGAWLYWQWLKLIAETYLP